MGKWKLEPVPEFCNQKDLAKILGVSAPRISQMEKHGLPKVARGKYSIAVAVQWFIDRRSVKGDGHGPPDSDPLQQAREKLYVSQKTRTDLENARLRRELIDAEEVKVAIQELGTIFSTQLDGLGGRLANELAGIHDPAEIQASLIKEARAIRTAAADQINALADTLNNSDDRPAAA